MNVPSSFQEMMYIIFPGIPFVLVYLDDVVVFSKSKEEHLYHLLQVFQLISKYGLKLKISNYSFVQPTVEVLGQIFNSVGVSVWPI